MKHLSKKMSSFINFAPYNTGFMKYNKEKCLILNNEFTLTGIEVELENVPGHMQADEPEQLLGEDVSDAITMDEAIEFYNFWVVAIDESLRGNAAREFIVKGPLAGKALERAILIWGHLLNHHLDPHHPLMDSYRSSTHIHVNYKDMTLKEFVMVLLTYTLVEGIIFAKYGGQRRRSNYCLPIQESASLRSAISSLINIGVSSSTGNIKSPIHDVLHNVPKYSALNYGLQKHSKISTLEFRHFPGCTTSEQLFLYVNLCHSVVNYQAGFCKELALFEFIEMLLDYPEIVVNSIFLPVDPAFVCGKYKSEISDGVRAISTILLSVDSYLSPTAVLNSKSLVKCSV